MLSDAELKEAFRQAEASLWLEGLDPNKSKYYQDLKAKVLSRELTFAEASALLSKLHKKDTESHSKE